MAEDSIPEEATVTASLTEKQSVTRDACVMLVAERGRLTPLTVGVGLVAEKTEFRADGVGRSRTYFRIERTTITRPGYSRVTDVSVHDQADVLVFWMRHFVEKRLDSWISHAKVHTHVPGTWERSIRRGARRIVNKRAKAAARQTTSEQG